MDNISTFQADVPVSEIDQVRSDRHHALMMLKQADILNERLAQFIQHLDTIALTLDQNGKILFLNSFGLNFFGYTEREIVGQQVLGTLIPNTTENSGRYLPKMLCRLLENPGSFDRNENENITRDGKRYLIAWKNWAIQDRQGKLIEIACLGDVIKLIGPK